MRRIFFSAGLAALLTIILLCQVGRTASSHTPLPLSDPPQKSDQVAKIKAYHDEIDAWAKKHPTAVRYFSNASEVDNAGVETSHWKEYKTRQELPDLQNHASVWMKDGKVVATILSFKSDHSDSRDGYYFRADGTLAYTESQNYSIGLDPPYMQGKAYYSANGKLISSTMRCSVDNGKWTPCAADSGWKDTEAGGVSRAYKKSTDLPFYSLLAKGQ